MEGLIAAIPGIILGLLSAAGTAYGIRRGMKADERADERASAMQLQSGFAELMDRLQADNAELRRSRDDERAQRVAMQQQLDDLKRKTLNG